MTTFFKSVIAWASWCWAWVWCTIGAPSWLDAAIGREIRATAAEGISAVVVVGSVLGRNEEEHSWPLGAGSCGVEVARWS